MTLPALWTTTVTALIRRLPFFAGFPAPAPHSGRAPRPAARPAARVAAAPAAPGTVSPLDARRSEAMRRMFPKLHPQCASRWELFRATEVHAYLAEAATAEDLERRIAAVEHANRTPA